MTRSPRRLGLGLFLAILGIYFLCGSRERPWADARVMYEVAENIVNHGRADVRTEWPPMSHRGADGRIYSIYGLFPSVVQVPGVLVRHVITYISPRAMPLATVITSHLAPALLGALTCLLFFGMARRLGASDGAAALGTILLALGTTLFVYARSSFSEVVQTVCYTGLLSELLRIGDEPTPRRARALGAWAGALLHSKLIFALAIAGAAVHVVWILRRDRPALVRVVLHACSTAIPLLALALAYNVYRWGGPFITGYESVYGNVRERIWIGLYGMLLSPGKGILLFSPPLIASLIALPSFTRARPRAALAILLSAVPPALYYSRYLSWSGDYCWGARYITYLLPAAMLPLALALDGLRRRRALLAGVAVLGVCGLGVQLLGSAFYWDHYIRISMAAKNAWLGKPDRRGASLPDKGGHCDSCFEDMYAHTWLPQFSPLEGHLWLLRHVPFGDDWKTAGRDAPWRRHTSLDLDIAEPYGRARVDWWGLVWLKDTKETTALGLGALITFLLVTSVGVTLVTRGRAPPRIEDS